MDNWLFISLFLLLCVVWFWLHFHPTSADKYNKKSAPDKKPTKTYHGITINPCSKSCEAVNQFSKKRFLASEVTQLPVIGCSNMQCTCSYVHHKDRRAEDDRRALGIAIQSIHSQNDHRQAIGERRKQVNFDISYG